MSDPETEDSISSQDIEMNIIRKNNKSDKNIDIDEINIKNDSIIDIEEINNKNDSNSDSKSDEDSAILKLNSSNKMGIIDEMIEKQENKMNKIIDLLEDHDISNNKIKNMKNQLDNKNRRYDLLLKENNIYKKKINKLRLKEALNQLVSDKKSLECNKMFNGYGILVKKIDDSDYKVIYHNKYIKDYNLKDIKKIEYNRLKLVKKDNSVEYLDFNNKYIIDFKESLKVLRNLEELNLKKNITNTLDELLEYIKYKRDTHGKSKKLYNLYNFGFIVPSIIITALSSILSFMASSEEFDEEISSKFTIVVGILAIISTALQTFSGSLDFSGKSQAHSDAYDDYDILYTNIGFELTNPKKSISNQDEFFENTKNSILDIKKKCKFIVPNDINKNYIKNQINKKMEKMKNNVLHNAMKKKTELINLGITQGDLNVKDINLEDIKNDLSFNV